ncbi:MAG: peptidoglycan-binding protein [Pseudomonadota bacterium]
MGFIEWVQRRLLTHDFNPGVVDGIWGRNSMNALRQFQEAKGLKANGLTTAATVAALRGAPAWHLPEAPVIVPVQPGLAEAPMPVPRPAAPEAPDVPKRDLLDYFPWMALAIRKKGMHEKRDNIDLRKFLKSDGKTLGDPARLPWCADFVETCIALSLPEAVLPVNPYLARNWQKFGHAVDPCFGSVLVFWRGKISGISGHVGFYYSEDKTHYHVLGGNQSNAVTVSKIAKRRLLSAQLPMVGGPYPRKVVKGAGDFRITTNEA